MIKKWPSLNDHIYFIQIFPSFKLTLFKMDPLIFVAAVPVVVSLYGVIKRQRFFFLLGYFLFSLIVIPDQVSTYLSDDGSALNLALALIWLLQAIIAFPNKLNYDGSKVFRSFAIKTFISLALINVFAVLLTQTDSSMDDGTRAAAGLFHAILVLFPVIATYLMLSNKIPVGTND